MAYGILDLNGRYIPKTLRINWPAAADHWKDSEQLDSGHADAGHNIPLVEEHCDAVPHPTPAVVGHVGSGLDGGVVEELCQRYCIEAKLEAIRGGMILQAAMSEVCDHDLRKGSTAYRLARDCNLPLAAQVRQIMQRANSARHKPRAPLADLGQDRLLTDCVKEFKENAALLMMAGAALGSNVESEDSAACLVSGWPAVAVSTDAVPWGLDRAKSESRLAKRLKQIEETSAAKWVELNGHLAAVAANASSLSSRFDVSVRKFAALRSELIERLDGSAAHASRDIDEVKAQLEVMESLVNCLSHEIDNVKNNVENTKENYGKLGEFCGSGSAETAVGLSARVDSLEASIGDNALKLAPMLSANTSAILDAINGMNGKMEERLDSLEARTREVEHNRGPGAKFEDRLNAMGARICAMEAPCVPERASVNRGDGTIAKLCRYYPNCRLGSACRFQHLDRDCASSESEVDMEEMARIENMMCVGCGFLPWDGCASCCPVLQGQQKKQKEVQQLPPRDDRKEIMQATNLSPSENGRLPYVKLELPR